MKYDIQKAFPYPVLSDNKEYNDDYPSHDFQASVALKSEGNEGGAILTARFKISEESILNCLENKTATYGVHVLCTKTNYRRLIPSLNQELEHKFKDGDLYDKVVLIACVICTAPIQEYQSENFHDELSGGKYNMLPGNVLAIAEPETYFVDAHPNRPLMSVFELAADDSIKKEFRYDIEGETIIIKMSSPDLERFNMARQDSTKRNFLIMAVYYPVLIEVLRVMSSDDGKAAHEDKKWYRAINLRLQKYNIEITSANDDNIYLYAQRLMEYPLTALPLEE